MGRWRLRARTMWRSWSGCALCRALRSSSAAGKVPTQHSHHFVLHGLLKVYKKALLALATSGFCVCRAMAWVQAF